MKTRRRERRRERERAGQRESEAWREKGEGRGERATERVYVWDRAIRSMSPVLDGGGGGCACALTVLQLLLGVPAGGASEQHPAEEGQGAGDLLLADPVLHHAQVGVVRGQEAQQGRVQAWVRRWR